MKASTVEGLVKTISSNCLRFGPRSTNLDSGRAGVGSLPSAVSPAAVSPCQSTLEKRLDQRRQPLAHLLVPGGVPVGVEGVAQPFPAGARNELVDLEELSDEDLNKLEAQFRRLRERAETHGMNRRHQMQDDSDSTQAG